jgi:hypothetical protein
MGVTSPNNFKANPHEVPSQPDGEGCLGAKLHHSVLKRLSGPSVRELAQRYPDRTVVHTISGTEWFEEQQRIEQALYAGGYFRTDYMELCIPAMEALVGDLHAIAMERSLGRYHVDSGSNENGDLEITMVFATVKDAMVFKMALP